MTLDKLGRAPSLKAAGPAGTPVQLATMSWNQSGALTSLAHQVNVFSSPTWSPLTFDRDDAIDSVGGALVWFWQQKDSAAATGETYRDSVTYDGWGRVRRWVEFFTAGGGATVTRNYDFDPMGNLHRGGNNFLYDRTTNRLTKELLGVLTYDRAGNLTAKLGAGITYGYDALERLVSVRQGGVLIVRYGYDVAGRRIAKRVYSGATGGTVGYLRMVYAGTQVAFETDSTNTGLSTIYTWGPGVDNLVAVKVGPTHYTVVTDALGSVRALVRRQDGGWAGRLRYDPYGQLVDSAGPQPALRYRWTGREWDAETGFYFHRSRYYDPGVGRFVQEDRIGYGGGGNLYAYVNGDVLQARDPDGLLREWTDAGRGFASECTMGGSFLQADGSVLRGTCYQYSGSGAGGGGGARALMTWAAAMSLFFDLGDYDDYLNNYERWQELARSLYSDIFGDALSLVLSGSPLSREQFEESVRATRSRLILKGHSEEAEAVVAWLVSGRVMLNTAFIRSLGIFPLHPGATVDGFTFFHGETWRYYRTEWKIANMMVHEWAHYNGHSDCIGLTAYDIAERATGKPLGAADCK